MSRHSRLTSTAISASMLLAALSVAAYAQRGGQHHPVHHPHATVVRGHVFIGGYFYDPVFGQYPWWPRPIYPYYYPVYDSRSELKLRLTPDETRQAAVYVDGFFAGIVDDFDGTFQSLPLPPGGHRVVLYLEGYRTAHHNIYLRPGSTFTLRETLERLPPGVAGELPDVAPPVPAPPAGSYRMPVTPPKVTAPAAPAMAAAQAIGFGILDLFVQPANAEVTLDGQRWISNEEGHFVVHVPAGRHRVEVSKPGYRTFVTEIEVRDSETTPLNVSLVTTLP